MPLRISKSRGTLSFFVVFGILASMQFLRFSIPFLKYQQEPPENHRIH